MQRTSWILLSPQTSIVTTRRSRPPDPAEDPGVVCLFASGAAHRGGALSRIQPLWLPPIATRGNPHLSFNSIRTSFPIHPVPETDSLHRCCPLTLVYLTCSPTHLSAKSCSCHADNSERLFPDWFPVTDLDCLPVNERTLPARSDLLCCVNLFSYLPAACPDYLPEYCLWFCLIYVVPDTGVWFMPVWPVWWSNKAAYGS